MEFSVLEFVAH